MTNGRAGVCVGPAVSEEEDYLRALGVTEFVDRNADAAAAVPVKLDKGGPRPEPEARIVPRT